jgi:hypothetical protein
MKTPTPDPDPDAPKPGEFERWPTFRTLANLPLPEALRGQSGWTQAVYSAWAAMQLAGAKAALLERSNGVNSHAAREARYRARRLREVLIAILRTPRDGA